MREVDLGLKIPAYLPLSIAEKLLTVIVEVDLGIILDTLPPITQATMVDCCVYLLLLVLFMGVFMTVKEVTVVVMMEDVDFGLKIPSTLPL